MTKSGKRALYPGDLGPAMEAAAATLAAAPGVHQALSVVAVERPDGFEVWVSGSPSEKRDDVIYLLEHALDTVRTGAHVRRPRPS